MKIIYSLAFILCCFMAKAQNKKPVINGASNFFALFGQTVCKDFTTSDADNDTVTVWWDNVLPKSTFLHNNKQAKFAAAMVCCTASRTTHNPTLPYTFTLFATDGKDTTSKTVTFVVPDFPENVHPVIQKVSGYNFDVDVLGDTLVPWDNYQGLNYESTVKDTLGNTVYTSQQRNFTFTATSKQKFRLYTRYRTDFIILTTIDTLQVDWLTGVDETSGNSFIYPNPANEIITVSFDNDFMGEAIITDVNGKTLIRTVIAGMQPDINIRQLVPGVYFLTVKNEQGEVATAQKLLKQ